MHASLIDFHCFCLNLIPAANIPHLPPLHTCFSSRALGPQSLTLLRSVLWLQLLNEYLPHGQTRSGQASLRTSQAQQAKFRPKTSSQPMAQVTKVSCILPGLSYHSTHSIHECCIGSWASQRPKS